MRKCKVCGKFISNEESIVLLKTKVTHNVLLGEWCSEECFHKQGQIKRIR